MKRVKQWALGVGLCAVMGVVGAQWFAPSPSGAFHTQALKVMHKKCAVSPSMCQKVVGLRAIKNLPFEWDQVYLLPHGLSCLGQNETLFEPTKSAQQTIKMVFLNHNEVVAEAYETRHDDGTLADRQLVLNADYPANAYFLCDKESSVLVQSLHEDDAADYQITPLACKKGLQTPEFMSGLRAITPAKP